MEGVDSDIDGDSHPDLITVDSDGTAHVFRGSATGIEASVSTTSLTEQVDPALLDGFGHYLIDTVDVSGEGRADLITIKSSGGVYVHKGTIYGGFGAAGAAQLTSLRPVMNGAGDTEPIALADVDGDRDADLVVMKGLVTVYRNNGDGTFESTGLTSLIGNSALLDRSGQYFLDAADVTGDGRADLVGMNAVGSAYVFKGDSSGSFVTPGVTTASINPIMDDGRGEEPVGLADINLDGKADLVTLDGTTLKLRAGNSDGTFATATAAYSGSIDSSLLDSRGQELIGLFDYTRDGRADLVAVDDQGDTLSYAAQSNGTFASPVTSTGSIFSSRLDVDGQEMASEKPFLRRAACSAGGCGWPPARAAPDDVDGDARSDLVTVDMDGTAHVFRGSATGIEAGVSTTSLTEQVDPALLDGFGHYLIDTVDVTGEGRADLVTMGSSGGVYLHKGKADRTFAAATAQLTSLRPIMNGAGDVEPIALADVDGDRDNDLVVMKGLVTVYRNNGDGTFESTGLTSLIGNSALLDRSGQYFLDAADVTGDGRADLVGMNAVGSAYVFKGDSSGSFVTPGVTTASINPIMDDGRGEEPVGLADINLDGKADLVTLDGTTLKLRAGNSDGTFATATAAYSGSIDSSLLDSRGQELIGLFDYTRDGRADLVAVDDQGDTLSYAAQSNGTFASPVTSTGSIFSSRLDVDGQEMASEKPFLRRAACSAGGCGWPPARAAPDDVDGDARSDLVTVDMDGTAHVFRGSATGIEAGVSTTSLTEQVDPALLDGFGHYLIDTVDVTGEGRADLVDDGLLRRRLPPQGQGRSHLRRRHSPTHLAETDHERRRRRRADRARRCRRGQRQRPGRHEGLGHRLPQQRRRHV